MEWFEQTVAGRPKFQLHQCAVRVERNRGSFDYHIGGGSPTILTTRRLDSLEVVTGLIAINHFCAGGPMVFSFYANFCPNCGADLRKEAEATSEPNPPD